MVIVGLGTETIQIGFSGVYTRTLLVPLIGDIWSLIVGTLALIEGRRRV